MTSGNPFFVTGLIAAGGARHPPPTIVDAVRARVRTVGPATRDLLEQLAVVPTAGDRCLVEHRAGRRGRAEHAWLHGGDPGALAALETT
nr:hypothetical protein [uncultured Actinoplanes sp.]